MFSSDGKPLFVCKAPCFAKLEQGMSKVIAVEKIIRDLHGPTGATLALPEAGMTLSPASCADACTQTDLSTCTTSTAASVAKRQETAILVLLHQSKPYLEGLAKHKALCLVSTIHKPILRQGQEI